MRCGKKRFLNELHEAFEKNPALRSASRERIEGALGMVLTRAQEAGVVRTDIDAPDLMQLLGSMCMSATLTPDQSGRLLVMIEDGLRPPAVRRRQTLEGSDAGVLRAHRVRVGHVRHQRVGRDRSQPTCFEVLEGLPDFGLRVHDEGPVVLDRLPDRLAPEDQASRWLGPGLGCASSARSETKSPAPNVTSCPLGDRPTVAAHTPGAGQEIDERVEAWVPRAARAGAPGATDACMKAIGVWVDPGPRCSPTSPAMIRTRDAAVGRRTAG